MRGLKLFVLIIIASNSCLLFAQSDHEECTIGVALGSACTDGRPLLWKTRDYSSALNNEVKYNTSYKYKFISVSNAGSATYSWMGVNEHGFAIVNSLTTDLPKGTNGPGNGELMRDVLGSCRTVDEFQSYLDSTNNTGRQTRANFGVIDSTDAAAIFETGDSIYWKFDATDSPNRYVIRTNFTINGGGTGGIERYNRSARLINDFYSGDSLSYKSIIRYQMRDFSDFNSKPVTIPFSDSWMPGEPFGYINSSKSICRRASVSAAVIHGVLPTELAGLSTMWTILGQPASSIFLPYWPVGNTPIEADGLLTSALCDKALEIKACLFDTTNSDYIDSYKLLDGKGGGLWSCTFPLENEIFADVHTYMDSLRRLNALATGSMIDKESYYSAYALSQLQNCHNSLISSVDNDRLRVQLDVYPNPFIDNFSISYSLVERSNVRIEVFSSFGKKMETLINKTQPTGDYLYTFSSAGNKYPDGVYFLTMFIHNKLSLQRMVKISN